jgi:hypothetical protein
MVVGFFDFVGVVFVDVGELIEDASLLGWFFSGIEN